MVHTSRTLYFVLIGWCLVGSSLRIVWFLRNGIAVDALPVITILLALAAIVHAFRPQRAGRTDP